MAQEEALDRMALILADDERYKKAEALHTRLSTPPTLQDLCSRFFIDFGDAIVTEWKKSGKNIFENLPDILKTDLLKYVFSRAHLNICEDQNLESHLYELTYMLMNRTTVMMNYICFWRRYTSVDEIREILTNAARKCPKLKNLAIQGNDFVPDAEDAISPRSGISHLLQLENLRHLHIHGVLYWKNNGLSQLFSHLKKLVVLKLMLHTSVTVSGFRQIHLLKELEQFHFKLFKADWKNDGPFFKCVYSYCAENVPSLKLIGGDTEEFKKDAYISEFSLLTCITPRIRGTSMLEYLHTRWALPRANFPNLKYLYFQGPISMDLDKFNQKFSNFTNLKDMILVDLTYNAVAGVLEFVGKQLVSLHVDVLDKMDFYQVLHLCPNLETFKQLFSNIRGNPTYEVVHSSKYQPLVTKHNVRLLKKVELAFDGNGTNGLLQLILFAPLLENFKLFRLSISKAECQMVQHLPEGNFPHLSDLRLYDLNFDLFCSLNDFGLFVQFLVCSAPHLNKLDFNWRHAHLGDQWESEQIVAQSYLELLQY